MHRAMRPLWQRPQRDDTLRGSPRTSLPGQGLLPEVALTSHEAFAPDRDDPEPVWLGLDAGRLIRFGAIALAIVVGFGGLALVWQFAAPRLASQAQQQAQRQAVNLDELTSAIGRLETAQQQLASRIEALQAGQQEIRNGVLAQQADIRALSDEVLGLKKLSDEVAALNEKVEGLRKSIAEPVP